MVLGSASGGLLRQTSEGLAGRVEQVAIGGFSLADLGPEADESLWLRGGFPLSYLAASEADSVAWRKSFIQALLERDFPQWGVCVPAVALRRFWTMVSHLSRTNVERGGACPSPRRRGVHGPSPLGLAG